MVSNIDNFTQITTHYDPQKTASKLLTQSENFDTEKSINSPDEIDNNVLLVNKENKYKITKKYNNFIVKECSKVKTIIYNNNQFSGLANPINSARSIFLNFNTSEFKYKLPSKLPHDGNPQLYSDFIEKFNLTFLTNPDIRPVLNRLTCLSHLLLSIMIFLIICIGILSALLLRLFIFVIVGYSKFHVLRIFLISAILLLLGLFIFHLLKLRLDSRISLLIFEYFLQRRNEMDNFLQMWNENYFESKNINVKMSRTFDYIQAFQDRNFCDYIESHV